MADQYGAIFSELERLFNRILRSLLLFDAEYIRNGIRNTDIITLKYPGLTHARLKGVIANNLE